MFLAERSMNYPNITSAHFSRIIEFRYLSLSWQLQGASNKYKIGGHNNEINTAGGVSLYYDYDANGNYGSTCDQRIWLPEMHCTLITEDQGLPGCTASRAHLLQVETQCQAFS